MYDCALVRTEEIRYIAYGIEPRAVSMKEILTSTGTYSETKKIKEPTTQDLVRIYEKWCGYVDKLFDIKTKGIKSKEIAKYPSITKDVSFILDNRISASDIMNAIYKKGGRIVNNVSVFDVFGIEDKKSLAFKITYQDMTKTLTDEEVTKSFESIISYIEKEFNAILRNK